MRWTSLSLCLAPLSALATAPTVKINATSIVGTSQLSATNVTVEFFGGQYTDEPTDSMAWALTCWRAAGIPFAEPPLGELRFAPSVATDTFATSTVNATAFGASCVQLGVRHECPGYMWIIGRSRVFC